MKSKKKLRSLLDTTFVVPITPVTTKNPNAPESNRELIRRLQEEERQQQQNADPIFQAQRQMNSAMAQARAVSAEYWSQPVEVLTETWDKSERAKDLTLSVPVIRDQFTMADAKAAFDIFCDQQLPKTAYGFASEQAGARLVLFGIAQAKAGADMSNPQAWMTAFEHVKDVLNAFADGELTVDAAKLPKPVEPPKPTVAQQLESLNLESDAGRRQANELLTKSYYESASPLHTLWMESLANNFGFTPSDADLCYLYGTETESRDPMQRGWFWRSNLSVHDRRSFDAARRHLVEIGRWPQTCLTVDELEANRVDSLNLAAMDDIQRRRMMSRTLDRVSR